MKLSTCIDHINNALNYPALSFKDIELFFDMAIAELNTTLHTSIPSVSKQIEVFRRNSSKDYTLVRLTVDPRIDNTIPEVSQEEHPEFPNVDLINNIKYCIFDKDSHYYTYSLKDHKYIKSETPLRGVYSTISETVICISLCVGRFDDGSSPAYWEIDNTEDVERLEMAEYLPDDWVLLWMIPYVCFKYTVKDGGTAQTFAEELQQGFQQLQDTYNVPEKVLLATVADKLAYVEIVKEKLPNLNIKYPTQAIYESMKHDRAVKIIVGSMFDRGGFGV